MSDAYQEYEYSLLIIERHLDTFSHVNNATYLEIFEEARWDITAQRGFTMADIVRLKQGPIVLEWNLKFKKELRLRQRITVKTKVLSYDRMIGIMSQNIFNEKGELCCEGRLTFGLFDWEFAKAHPPDSGVARLPARKLKREKKKTSRTGF